MADRKMIERYWEQDIDTLYSLLALEETSRAEGLRCAPGQEIPLGKRILQRINDVLFQKICVEWEYCRHRNDPDLADSVNLAAAIADIIVVLSLEFPPALISVLLVKKGLSKFCKCSAESALPNKAMDSDKK